MCFLSRQKILQRQRRKKLKYVKRIAFIFFLQQFPNVVVIGEEEQDDLSGVEKIECESQFEMDPAVLASQVPENLKDIKDDQVGWLTHID